MKVVGTTVNERRRNSRPKLPPIRIRFCGEPFTTTEWSLGGFLVEPYMDKQNLCPGDEITVDIFIDLETSEKVHTLQHTVQAEVARIDRRNGKLAAEFLAMDEAVIDTLEGWLTGRLRRQMARKAKKPSTPRKRPNR